MRSICCGRIRRATGLWSALEFDALDTFEPVEIGDQAGGSALGTKTDPVGQIERSTLLGRGRRGQFELVHGSREQAFGGGADPFRKPDAER